MGKERLTLRIFKGTVFHGECTITADPGDIGAIQDAARGVLARNGWSKARFSEFTVDVDEPGRRTWSVRL